MTNMPASYAEMCSGGMIRPPRKMCPMVARQFCFSSFGCLEAPQCWQQEHLRQVTNPSHVRNRYLFLAFPRLVCALFCVRRGEILSKVPESSTTIAKFSQSTFDEMLNLESWYWVRSFPCVSSSSQSVWRHRAEDSKIVSLALAARLQQGRSP